ncbi:MAG: hypothetical protein KJO11_07740 [Gemmatimonadetes bacterium]|nr:hypothetical protein [Gemmatimonadota bacterium]NNK64824.1 hypothetical protein [Gemmatimonadota bacterium]
MAGSFSNSWSLVKASAHVLKLDKELLVFPLLSGVATVLVALSFIAPFALTGAWETFAGEGGSYLGYVVGFLFYMVQYTVIFFFNSALVGAAMIRLEGGDPTVSDGMSIAMDRIGTILGYAALSATVGMVLRFVSERVGFIGRIVVGFVGIGWTVATYLAVPILVSRDVGPIDAVKESAALFKRTWGEQMVASFGIGWAVFLMGVSWTLAFALILVGATQLGAGAAVILPIVAAGVMGYVLLGLIASALQGIYTAALYRHASGGHVEGFDAHMLEGAFRAPRGFGRR